MARPQHEVWEAIAHSFDRSRRRAWPHVEDFLDTLPAGARLLDLMGGNGRHLGPALRRGLRPAWLDWSRPAAAIVARRHPGCDAVVADATALPLRAASFDAALLVAGLHGLPTPAGRHACLRELHRALAPGAPAQVTVWSRDAPRFRSLGEPGRPLDVTLPWRSDGHDEMRHCHLYTPQALRTDLESAGFQVTRLEGVAIASRAGPDNLVATVRQA